MSPNVPRAVWLADTTNGWAVALQDFVGHAWPHSLAGHRTTENGRRHETSLWRFRREPSRRPPPSGRMRRVHMPRRVFLAVAFGWITVVASLLAVILAIRWLG
jgi:hypothetical protein